MDETGLISSLSSYLSAQLDVPVRTYPIDDERPVPLVMIDDWTIRDIQHHNSPFAGDETVTDKNGDEHHCRYLTFDYRARIEIMVRHTDAVESSKLKSAVKQEFRLIRQRPGRLDESVKECKLITDGNPTSNFTEPKEDERMVAVSIRGDHTITLTPESSDFGDADTEHDVLESVSKSFTFDP